MQRSRPVLLQGERHRLPGSRTRSTSPSAVARAARSGPTTTTLLECARLECSGPDLTMSRSIETGAFCLTRASAILGTLALSSLLCSAPAAWRVHLVARDVDPLRVWLALATLAFVPLAFAVAVVRSACRAL